MKSFSDSMKENIKNSPVQFLRKLMVFSEGLLYKKLVIDYILHCLDVINEKHFHSVS